MRSAIFLGLLVVSTAFTSSASGAVVRFFGVLDDGSGGTALFGTIPPDAPRTFTLDIVYTPTFPANFIGTITGGTLDVSGPVSFGISGGQIVVSGAASPAEDTVLFLADVVGPATGSFVFQMSRDAITGGDATASNIYDIVEANTDDFTLLLDTAGTYSGSITGVPEPSSCFMLVGLVTLGAVRRRRKLA